MTFALLLFYLLAPVFLIFLCQKVPLLEKLGVVVVSFIVGIAIAATGLLPEGEAVKNLQSGVSSTSVAIALSLLLFSIDVWAALKLSGTTLKSMMFAVLSVMTMAIVAAIIFAPYLPFMWQIAGMSTGAYIGGGPNMAAIKVAIDADQGVFTDMLTYDILLSALYVLFVITFAKPIFSKFLPAYQQPKSLQEHSGFEHLSDDSSQAYRVLAKVSLLPKTLLALLIAILIVGLSVGVSKLFSGAMAQAVIIITITTLGLLTSFIPFVRALPNSYPLGMYLILIFCFASGTMVDTSVFYEIKWALFGYIATIMIGSMILQSILCRIFKIDVDTFLISSSASIMSVPFIPVIAGALKNRFVLVPGFAAAIIGYILGNYLGVMVAFAIRAWVG
ncbi:MAG: hypothetical protein RL217_1807 [Pseudomonadota bacterium]